MDEPTQVATVENSVPPTARELFDEALSNLMSGNLDAIGPDEWRLLAIQGGMRVALVLIALFLALTVAGWMAAVVRSSLTRMKFDPTLTKFLAKLTRWGVLMLATIACLGTFGVEMTAFAAILGAAGFAIGLAFQGTLSNFAAGAMLLIFRPFKVGDVVNISGQLGKVDEIELFTTTIDTFDNRRIILPNSSVFGATIENITYHPVRRVDVAVGCAYDADIDTTRRILESAIAITEGGLNDPEPAVVLDGLGASSVDWVVRVWAPTSEFSSVKQSLLRAIKLQLDEAKIGIPFPQMDIHVQPVEANNGQRAA